MARMSRVSTAKWRMLFVIATVSLLAIAGVRKGPRLVQLAYHSGLSLVTVAAGLDTPWSMAFLPDGRILVTERVGNLRIVRQPGVASAPIRGLPPVIVRGESGLLGVVVDPDFANNHLIYWSFAEGETGSAKLGVAVARGRLEGEALADVRILLRDPDKVAETSSFGGRMAFLPDRTLLVTLGDRTHRDDAQALHSLHGKIVRIGADGTIPTDNPFLSSPAAHPAIWALGFRDPQGITVNPRDGTVWASDHGPGGGDEIDLVVRGHNYGWPVVSYGVDETTGAKIGEGTEKAGMDPAALWWVAPGVPPTGMTFVNSRRYPDWQGQLLVGTLWNQALVRIQPRGRQAIEQQRLYLGKYDRVRDVCQGPDGWLYAVSNSPDGRIIRLER